MRTTIALPSMFLGLVAVQACASTSVDVDETGARGHRVEAANEDARADVAPTLTDADLHRAHARAHLAAARELERFEAEECSGIPQDHRSSCPLLSGVTKVQPIPEGTRVHFETAQLASNALRIMRCHVAFSRATKDDDAGGCPLYVKGMSVRPGLVEDSIDFFGNTDPVRAEIRERIERLFARSIERPPTAER